MKLLFERDHPPEERKDHGNVVYIHIHNRECKREINGMMDDATFNIEDQRQN